MTSAQVIDHKGNKVREVELDKDVFGLTPNKGLMHTALVRQLANARAGSANTKTRSEVSGGGKKPWRQKGTGRARAGSIRSPLWEGGGVAFGPKPRDYSKKLNKKMRVLAVKSALSARSGNLVVVDNFDSIKEGKTKEFAQVLKSTKLADKKVLLVIEYSNEHSLLVERSARNMEWVKVVHVGNLNVKDLIEAEVILLTEKGLDTINKRFQKGAKGEAQTPAKPKAAKKEAGEKKAKAAKPAKESKSKDKGEAKDEAPKAKKTTKKSES
ncbi:MAG TPA: 50S ribosomal protein L4 [Candidatus Melainabacteria bacterium]|nr:50S ribosomal protein L4 [Candidatus Melainabacteria bacterium]